MTSVSSVGGTPGSFARLIYTPQECPLSQPPHLIAARVRLMTSRCRGPSRSLCSWTSREKRRKQCLWNFPNIFTKIRFIITPNSSLDSAWIAVQESETLVTVRNQLSRIFDTEYRGTLSLHAQTFKVFRMHNRTVKYTRVLDSFLVFDGCLLILNLQNRLQLFSSSSLVVWIASIAVRHRTTSSQGTWTLPKTGVPYTSAAEATAV